MIEQSRVLAASSFSQRDSEDVYLVWRTDLAAHKLS